jgi:acetyl esterase/lipase
MLDDRSPTSRHPYTGEFGWTRERNHLGWSALLGREPGGHDVSPYAAAARAKTLEGLPPAFIGVGTLDLFLEENVAYALRLTEAGVPVELHVYPGAFHGSDLLAAARLTKMHARDQLEALRAAFTR